MAFHSFEFLFFLGAVLIVYYILPGVCRRWVLLGANLLFYLYVGWEKLIFFVVTSLIVYCCSVFMGKQYEKMQEKIRTEEIKGKEKSLLQTKYKKICKKPLIASVMVILGVLIYCKYTNMLIDFINQVCDLAQGSQINAVKVIVPLGISYYTFSSVGYLLDIYWRKKKYEKNYIDFFVSMSFFPQMVQGPIARYPKVIEQVKQLKGFEYQRFCMALQLMLWGYFKKMVIADRMSVFVNQIFGHIGYYRGLVFVVALAGSAVQLYADFSGCMDIVEGVAELFGITLDKNFDLPFSSQSTAEFWRRWHITLGAWFKDYVFFPMSTSSLNIKISRFFKNKFGTRAGKTVTSIIPLIVVWLLTGIWHGTGMNYVVWGCYYGHRANDFVDEYNRWGNVYAADNGIVSVNTYDSISGWYVKIDHQNGYVSYYGHMNQQSPLAVGTIVTKGQVIGDIGMTGLATGPHVHFYVAYEGVELDVCNELDGFPSCQGLIRG